MTPQTVPSKPMNGPPATAVERMIIPFSKARPCALAARSRETLTWSKDAGTHLGGDLAGDDVRLRPCSARAGGGRRLY